MCFINIDSSIDPSRLIAFLGFSLLRCASNFYFVMDLFSFLFHNYTLTRYHSVHLNEFVLILFLLLCFRIIISNICRFENS